MYQNSRKNHVKAPDYTGKIRLNGKLYYISAWIATAKSTRCQYLSINLSDPDTIASYKQPKHTYSGHEPKFHQPMPAKIKPPDPKPLAPVEPPKQPFVPKSSEDDGFIRANKRRP